MSVEQIARVGLMRSVKVGGCLDWNENSNVVFSTKEGVAVLEWTIPANYLQLQPTITAELKPVPVPASHVEPCGLNRKALISEVSSDNLRIQSMKLDTVLCPGLRSMGDPLTVKQVLWKPGPSPDTVAALGQQLIVYRRRSQRWQPALNVNEELSAHLDENPLENRSGDAEQKFLAYSRHVRRFTWASWPCNGQSHSPRTCLLVVNLYNGVFAVCEGEDNSSGTDNPASRPTVSKLDMDCGPAAVSSVCWMGGGGGSGCSGRLMLGFTDGCCRAAGIGSGFDVREVSEVKVSRDQRSVEHLHQIAVQECLFVKHNLVYIAHVGSGVVSTYSQSESKYSLNHATADDTLVYMATVDKGFIIMSRENSQVVQTLYDPVYASGQAVLLSRSRSLLLTLSQPQLVDFYQHCKPLQLRLYQMKPFAQMLADAWQSDQVVTPDVCLLIESSCCDYPDWFIQLSEGRLYWNDLSDSQLKLLNCAFSSLLKHRHLKVFTVKRMDHTKLQLLLTARRLRRTANTESQQQLMDGVLALIRLDSWDDTLLPAFRCPICQKESRLNSAGLFACIDRHAFPRCVNSFEPIAVNRHSLCERGCGSANLPADSESQATCAYCDSALIENLY